MIIQNLSFAISVEPVVTFGNRIVQIELLVQRRCFSVEYHGQYLKYNIINSDLTLDGKNIVA